MPTFIRAKLRNKRTGETTVGYRRESEIRGRTVDLFVYRRSGGGWDVLHYPTGFLLGLPGFSATREAAASAVSEWLAANESDYVLDQAARATFDAGRCFAAPCEAVGEA